MYSRIIVPLDGSNNAELVLPYVRALATGMNARIELVRVVEPVRFEITETAYGVDVEGILRELRQAGEEYLHATTRSLSDQGFSVAHALHDGLAAEAIVRLAAEAPDTLIAMSARGLSAIPRWLLGSVTDSVLHSAETPVLVTKWSDGASDEDDGVLKTVIVPLDGSELAESALPHATAIAAALKLSVTLAWVTDTPVEFRGTMDLAGRNYLSAAAKKVAAQGVTSVDQDIFHGDPADAILDLAEATPGSLVAMATHGRSAPVRFIVGSVTDRVVHHSSSPVLVIRPGHPKSD